MFSCKTEEVSVQFSTLTKYLTTLQLLISFVVCSSLFTFISPHYSCTHHHIVHLIIILSIYNISGRFRKIADNSSANSTQPASLEPNTMHQQSKSSTKEKSTRITIPKHLLNQHEPLALAALLEQCEDNESFNSPKGMDSETEECDSPNNSYEPL